MKIDVKINFHIISAFIQAVHSRRLLLETRKYFGPAGSGRVRVRVNV